MSSTTLTGTGISPATTKVKTSKFVLRKHDYIGLAFAFIVASPIWFVLAFQTSALRLWITYGGLRVTFGVVAFEIVAIALTAVCVKAAMPKDGAK